MTLDALKGLDGAAFDRRRADTAWRAGACAGGDPVPRRIAKPPAIPTPSAFAAKTLPTLNTTSIWRATWQRRANSAAALSPGALPERRDWSGTPLY
ncbi:hypothetical protein ACTMU2_12350 [Cupriavidus basilensis]